MVGPKVKKSVYQVSRKRPRLVKEARSRSLAKKDASSDNAELKPLVDSISTSQRMSGPPLQVEEALRKGDTKEEMHEYHTTDTDSNISTTQTIERHLISLLHSRNHPKTICPSEVARAFSEDDLSNIGVSNWRDLMNPNSTNHIHNLLYQLSASLTRGSTAIFMFEDCTHIQILLEAFDRDRHHLKGGFKHVKFEGYCLKRGEENDGHVGDDIPVITDTRRRTLERMRATELEILKNEAIRIYCGNSMLVEGQHRLQDADGVLRVSPDVRVW
ncbi:MAG: hypothetical protein Q9170_004349 [Blastenia crenularia]